MGVPFPFVDEIPDKAREQLYRNFVEPLPATVLFSTGQSLVNGVFALPWYPSFKFSLLTVRINVAVAPASTVTVDILKNGTSIFTTAAKPQVAAAALVDTAFRVPDVHAFLTTDKIEVEVEAHGGATGLVVSMNIERRP